MAIGLLSDSLTADIEGDIDQNYGAANGSHCSSLESGARAACQPHQLETGVQLPAFQREC
jgi:hypothetical protein